MLLILSQPVSCYQIIDGPLYIITKGEEGGGREIEGSGPHVLKRGYGSIAGLCVHKFWLSNGQFCLTRIMVDKFG